MPHRIEVELTSVRPDGTWTWRAAGAREPRGVLSGSLLYEGAKVGDVVRAEAEFDVDGITVLAVLPPRPPRANPARIEILGPPREASPLVTGSARGLRDEAAAAQAERPPARPAAGNGQVGRRRHRVSAPLRAEGTEAEDRSGPRARTHRPRPLGEGRPERPARGPEARRGRAASSEPREPLRAAAGPEPHGGAPSGADEGRTERRRRVPVRRAHQAALLASLSPEERAVAEQLVRGGLAAVRQALEARNAEARAAARPEVPTEPLLAIAEALYPRVKAAVWRDRAEAAATMLDEVPLRDLRALVAGAEGALRDDESRLLAARLREALERRVEALRERWLGEVTRALDEGEALRALRLSARPPDVRTRFPSELAVRLATAASHAMAPETPQARWLALLEAVAMSPVRRSVRPLGLPRDAGHELLAAARQAAGRVPALAPLLGIEMPPPPGPPRRPPGDQRRGRAEPGAQRASERGSPEPSGVPSGPKAGEAPAPSPPVPAG